MNVAYSWYANFHPQYTRKIYSNTVKHTHVIIFPHNPNCFSIVSPQLYAIMGNIKKPTKQINLKCPSTHTHTINYVDSGEFLKIQSR